MNESEDEGESLSALIRALDVPDASARDAAWMPVRALGVSVIPGLADYLPLAKHWQCRASIVVYLGPFSRGCDTAFYAGIGRLRDKSDAVRYAACALCAYSLRSEALQPLQTLLDHPSPRTAAGADAAIDAIVHKNHHYFRDRAHSGQVEWDYARF